VKKFEILSLQSPEVDLLSLYQPLPPRLSKSLKKLLDVTSFGFVVKSLFSAVSNSPNRIAKCSATCAKWSNTVE